MRKKYGIQIKGLGKALRAPGLGVLRPKPTGKGGKPLRQKPIRPGRKDGGKIVGDYVEKKRSEFKSKRGGKIVGENYTMDEKRRGREAPRRNLKKVKPNQKGLQQLPKDVRNKMGYMKDGGRANTRRMNRLEELGRVDSEKAYSRKGKKNLKSEKRRIVRELSK